jgi:hypothetical protein
MRLFLSIAALAALSASTVAQTAAPANPLRRPAATAPAPAAESDTPRRARAARQASTGDYKERRKRCSGEWRAAKAGNTTGGQKWPQFFSACNTRLKAAGV